MDLVTAATPRTQLAAVLTAEVWRLHGPMSTDEESAEMDGADLADAALVHLAERLGSDEVREAVIQALYPNDWQAPSTGSHDLRRQTADRALATVRAALLGTTTDERTTR